MYFTCFSNGKLEKVISSYNLHITIQPKIDRFPMVFMKIWFAIVLPLLTIQGMFYQDFEITNSNLYTERTQPSFEFDANIQYESNRWWTPRYLIDYALVTGGIAGYAIGKDLVPQSKSMIGPTYNPDNLLELFESDKLNRPYLEQDVEESVPEYWIHRSIAVSGAFLLGMEWREHRNGRGSPQRIHQTFVGYAEAVALNAAITELLKPVFARLRPDFRERALRFHCHELTGPEFNLYCDDFRDMPLDDDPDKARDLLEDGRKSFFSGHSSNSFSLFGYTSLAIGGRYVWGRDTTRRSKIFGIVTQAGIMSFATYISASRVHDGRHFASDTIVGAAVGTAIANASYWRRFDRNGDLRGQRIRNSPDSDRFRDQAHMSLDPWVGGNVAGLQLNLRF